MEIAPLKFYVALARTATLKSGPVDLALDLASNFLQYSKHFDPTSQEMRLKPSTKDYYVDYLRSVLAGRLGYALGAIYLESKGFSWFAHFENIADLVIPSSEKPSQRPDLVTTDLNSLALLECKGQISKGDIWNQGNSSVTHAYRSQVAPWLNAKLDGTPIPSGFAVGAQLHTSDTAKLLIGYKEPETIEGGLASIVLRNHYARWFQLTGLWPQSWDLLDPQQPSSELYETFIRVPIGDLSFLVHIPDNNSGSVVFRGACLHPLWWKGRPLVLGLEEHTMGIVWDLANDPTLSEQAREESILHWATHFHSRSLPALHQLDTTHQQDFAVFMDGSIAFTEAALMSAKKAPDFITLPRRRRRRRIL